uniref:Uncharacterized protein n=1 Tax=Panagrolaimus sp. PS1159 TaxID=55785 RepID=A0AC35FGW0_9BILA
MASPDRASPINLSLSSRRESPTLRISKTPQLLQFEQIQKQQNCNTEIAECLSKSNSPISTPKKLRKHAPYRLDRAVRKLTDRLEATKDTVSPKKSSSTPLPSSPTPAEAEDTQNRSTSAELMPNDTSSNTSSTENVKPGEEAVPTSESSELTLLNPPALNGHFDPITFMMLKNLAANHSALKNHAIKRLFFYYKK